jgi:hypothetical protein
VAASTTPRVVHPWFFFQSASRHSVGLLTHEAWVPALIIYSIDAQDSMDIPEDLQTEVHMPERAFVLTKSKST